jgi:hypothetical protein
MQAWLDDCDKNHTKCRSARPKSFPTPQPVMNFDFEMMLANGRRRNKPFLVGPPPLHCPSIPPKAALRSDSRLILNDDD